jgi:endo-1,4-beta-xylanase
MVAAKIRDTGISYGWTPTLPQGQWVEAVVDIRASCNDPSMSQVVPPFLSKVGLDPLPIVRACDTFKIMGWPGNDSSPSFLLDSLRWLDRDHIRVDDTVDSIRKYCVKPPISCLQSLVDSFVDAIVQAIRAAFNGRRGKPIVGRAPRIQIYVGSYAEYADVFSVADAKLPQALAQEFNLLCFGSHWYEMEPTERVYAWEKTDAMRDFALGNGMQIFSYMGGWHQQLPDWANDGRTPSELRPLLLNYISEVGRRYCGQIAIWNVFNEVVADDGNGLRNWKTTDYDGKPKASSPWVDDSDPFPIEEAFREARRADPTAKLFLNDFNVERIGQRKSETFYGLVGAMQLRDVPIDGVGFQAHICGPSTGFYLPGPHELLPGGETLEAYLGHMDESVKRYAALGLLVNLSEVDVPLQPFYYLLDSHLGFPTGVETGPPANPGSIPEWVREEERRRLEYQAWIYDGLMGIALNNWNVLAYNTWGCTDRYSWVNSKDPIYGGGGYVEPQMLDVDFGPKPAYDALLKTLKAWS